MWTQAYKLGAPYNQIDDGDKLYLPPSALESLLNQSVTNGDRFSAASGQFAEHSYLESQSSQLPSPITFEIRNVKTRNIVYGGVKEFSAEEGMVHLPQWMQKSLQLELGDHVAIRLKELPKGTWARLRPISSDYKEIMDYRAALESFLRANYNTLTAGEILDIKYGSNRYQFLVDDLKPEKAVCVTDTDIEIDIEPLVNDNTLAHIQAVPEDERSSTRTLIVGQNWSGAVGSGQYSYLELNLENLNSNLELTLVCTEHDSDFVVDVEKNPKLSLHIWSDLSSHQEKSIIIPLNELHGKQILYIGIYGADHDKTSSFTFTTKAIHSATLDQPKEDVIAQDSAQCENCGAWVPERTMVLHERFCLRNNVRCPWGCGAVFKKDSEELQNHWHCDKCDMRGTIFDKEKHEAYFHQEKTCDCGFKTTSITVLAKHRKSECPMKLIICRYCRNLVPQENPPTTAQDILLGLYGHESYCGSRTIECQKCHKQIPIKDIQVHSKVHQIERQGRTLPPICSNVNCTRPASSNILKLCQNCFGPFWISTNDPGNVKLMQRVARKYHLQLTSGCGKQWCRNKFCATGNGQPKDATEAAQALIPLIHSLQQQLKASTSNPVLHLCVDESAARQLALAEDLHALVGHRYSLAWCIKAVQTEKEDIYRAKDWVEDNAPLPK
ncbi:hypothetical protein NQZ79_g2688 [Umbelopsis isabellina]|nr:hypothetical protein NQZ79_g2688 [Umbelopsis isabellina]